jgi:transmembrane sensor
MDQVSNERTLQEAARWYARLQAADCSDAERAAFQQWQQRLTHNAAAYALAERVSRGLDSLAADQRLQALADEALAACTRNQCPVRRTAWLVPAAMAASIAIAAVGLRFSIDVSGEPRAVAYETAVGERRSVLLSDGSSVAMDVGTRLSVRMSAERREIELLSGRALFDVAHDSTRPFSVTAAGSRTTALGTRFQVQQQDDKVVVVLEQGSVAISPEQAGSASWRERLWPGEQLSIDRYTAARDRQAVDPQIATSWIQGRHVFRGTPLREALSEVNRYAHKKVHLGDPTLADLPVGGNFIAGDSEQIVAAFAAVLPLRVVVSGDDEVLLFRRHDAAR